MLPMSREVREMLGDNEEALALYTREYGKANQKELWTPADFAKERVFEAVSTGKFYILVRLRAQPGFSASLTTLIVAGRQPRAAWNEGDGGSPDECHPHAVATVALAARVGAPGGDSGGDRGGGAGRGGGESQALAR